MKKSYDFGVFIGRFQPYHIGHQALVDSALKNSKNLIIVLGSADSPRTINNPFSAAEREKMIRYCHPGANLHFISLPDFHNKELWLTALQHKINEKVEEIVKENFSPEEVSLLGRPRLSLYGFKKDKSSEYLNDIEFSGEFTYLNELSGKRYPQNATDIRKAYFEEGSTGEIKIKNIRAFPIIREVPGPVFDYLSNFEKTDNFKKLQSANRFTTNYIERTQTPISHFVNYAAKRIGEAKIGKDELIKLSSDHEEVSPSYPVQFVAVDAVCLHRGHILVIKRFDEFGKDLLALPGGFVKPTETILDATIRELKEETTILRNKEALRSDVAGRPIVFDEPSRSLRGRTFSHATLFKIPSSVPPILVKANDDASGAYWMSLAEIQKRRSDFFEDHIHIIETMIGGAGLI